MKINVHSMKKYYAYAILNNNGDYVFASFDKYHEIFALRPLMRVADFVSGATHTLELIGNGSERRIDAENDCAAFMRQKRDEGHQFPYNLQTHHSRADTKILCDQNGQTYDNQLQCANALGISQSALSGHLNGQRGFKSVKGFTFRYTKANPTLALPATVQHMPAPMPAIPQQPVAVPYVPAPMPVLPQAPASAIPQLPKGDTTHQLPASGIPQLPASAIPPMPE
jgi:hypothetical protein